MNGTAVYGPALPHPRRYPKEITNKDVFTAVIRLLMIVAHDDDRRGLG